MNGLAAKSSIPPPIEIRKRVVTRGAAEIVHALIASLHLFVRRSSCFGLLEGGVLCNVVVLYEEV